VCTYIFNDILVYSQTYEDHSNLLELVFQLLHQEKCRVKRSKCSFAKREICYLRYVIRAAGVATSPAKV
jgi:hypothetical protein